MYLRGSYGHHPVSTKNEEAQRFFDQGLTLIYALDYSEAAKAFQRAAGLDPTMAMAYWGISYAMGSDYYYPLPATQFANAKPMRRCNKRYALGNRSPGRARLHFGPQQTILRLPESRPPEAGSRI